MTNHDLVKSKMHLVVSAVALVFCIVWALVGEADIKIVAVAIAFMYFLKSAVQTEDIHRALHTHH